MPLWIKLPHEAIAAEVLKNPERYDLSKVPKESYMTTSYMAHPIVRQYGSDTVLAVGFYTDKAKMGVSDNFYRGV